MKQQVKVKKLNDKAILPTYGSKYSAGSDLYACMDAPVDILPGETVLVKTGLAMAIPEGYAGLIYARSGLATKKGLHRPIKWASLMRIIAERLWCRFTIIPVWQ